MDSVLEGGWNWGKKAAGDVFGGGKDLAEGLGGWLTGAENKGQRRQRRLIQQGVDLWDELAGGSPSVSQLTPRPVFETASPFLLNQAQAALARPDQDSVAAQRAALDSLANWDNGTLRDMQQQGMTSAERNMYNTFLERSNREQAAAQQAALANLAQRGRTGGSQELLARLTGAGNSAMAAADLGSQMGMNAQSRALTAATNYGQLQQGAQRAAGQLAGQRRLMSFNERFARGQANDARQQANMDWQRSVAMRNNQRRNQFMRDQAAAHQQNFNNRYRTTASRANARMGLGAFEGGQGDRFTRYLNNLGQQAEIVGQGVKMFGGAGG